MRYATHHFDTPAPEEAAPPSGLRRFATELILVVACVALVWWFVSLLTYSPQDAAWSTSGTGAPAMNRGGWLGAWLADFNYFLFGFSSWWLWAASALAAWGALRRRLRQTTDTEARTGLSFWPALAVLLIASSALEWSRLYAFEAHLPGHSGGVLGYGVGRAALAVLGFAGSGVVELALCMAAMPWVFHFSWLRVCETLGARIESAWHGVREKREVAQDREIGLQAMREREETVTEEREEIVEHHPDPVLIAKPKPLDLPPSQRVAKERQKPLFVEMPDSNLPQVALLDEAQLNQETVSVETLEMTSRMIEKKLKDFGVEVRVVLAQPGPVITRNEIEPATGVKGSQIVGLAKDLARSLSLVSIRVVETIPGKN